MPVVHFLCKHSFHQRCLNDPSSTGASSITAAAASTLTRSDGTTLQGTPGLGAVECPICAPSNATVRAIRKAQEEGAEMHDLFLDALAKPRDRFGTVSEWFGRGVMTNGGVAD
jgi:hypothetical protein